MSITWENVLKKFKHQGENILVFVCNFITYLIDVNNKLISFVLGIIDINTYKLWLFTNKQEYEN